MIAMPQADQIYTPVFDDLFVYVHELLLTEAGIDPDANDFDVLDAVRACSGNLKHVHQFCYETDVDFGAVESLLQSTGGSCDCEVMLNSTMQLDKDTELPVTW